MLLDTTRSVGTLLGHHERDNEDLLPATQGEETWAGERRRCVRRLASWGAADAACIAGLLMCASAQQRRDASSRLLALVFGSQIGKTYCASRQYGVWNCTKVHLGDAAARKQQRAMNRTIVSMEQVAFWLLSTTMGTSIFLGLNRWNAEHTMQAAIPLLGASSALGAISAGAFLLASKGAVAPLPLPQDEREQQLLHFAGKARVFANLLAHEPDYRYHALAIFLSKVGLGLVNSGYLSLMGVAGSAGVVATISAIEDFVRFYSALLAHHQRDDEDLLETPLHLRRAWFERRLAACGLADAAIIGALCYGLSMPSASPQLLRPLLASVKLTEAYVRGRELGYWSCLKMYLGHAQARQEQRDINRTIAGFEMLALSLVSHTLSIAVYALLKQKSHCLFALGVGALLTCGSRLYFCREAWRPARAAVDESTPLLHEV